MESTLEGSLDLPASAPGARHAAAGGRRGARPRAILRDWLRSANGRACLAAAAIVPLHLLLVVILPPGPLRTALSDLAGTALSAAAAAAAWVTTGTATLDARTRRAWRLCAAAFTCYAAGNALWLVEEVALGHATISAWTRAVYLLSYPLLLSGFLTFPGAPRSPGERRAFWHDIALVFLAGGAVVWYLALEPALGTAGDTALDRVLSFAYPVADLALLFASAAVYLRGPTWGTRTALGILAAGGAAKLGANLAFGFVVVSLGGARDGGQWLDVAYQVPALLWLLAAQYQRWRERTGISAAEAEAAAGERAPRLAVAGISTLPYLAIAVGNGLLIGALHAEGLSLSSQGVVLVALLITLTVVSRQLAAMRENARLEARFRTLVQHSSDVIAVVRADSTVTFASPSVSRVFGWTPEAATGGRLLDYIHPDDVPGAAVFFAALQETPGATESIIVRVRDAAGGYRHLEARGTCMADDPVVGGIVLNARDISERIALEAKLSLQARQDPLTGLANRTQLQARIEAALTDESLPAARVALLFLDLDDFKRVNDSHGHAEGDRVLVEVAARLRNATRGSDTVARLGGDEFAVLMENITRAHDIVIVAERIAQAMRRPIALRGGPVVVGASVGVARARLGDTAADLLHDADVAMYVAKRGGKGHHVIFEEGMGMAGATPGAPCAPPLTA